MFAALQVVRSEERASVTLRRLVYGYNAVLTGEALDCRARSKRLSNAGRLKTKADMRGFVTGCNVGAHDAGLTE